MLVLTRKVGEQIVDLVPVDRDVLGIKAVVFGSALPPTGRRSTSSGS